MEVSFSPTFWASEATLRLQPALEEGLGSAYLFQYVQDAPLIRHTWLIYGFIHVPKHLNLLSPRELLSPQAQEVPSH